MPAASKLAISILIAACLVSPAVAGTSQTNGNQNNQSGPLVAGHPAGVRKAQSMSELATYGLAAGFAAVIIVAVASGPDNSVGISTTTVVSSTSTQ
jgi:hypothetical protein